MIRFLSVASVSTVVLMIGISNLHLVELNTIFADEIQTSLAFLLFGAFAGGFASASLLGTHRALQIRRDHRKQFDQEMSHAAVMLPAPPQIPTRTDQRKRRRFSLRRR